MIRCRKVHKPRMLNELTSRMQLSYVQRTEFSSKWMNLLHHTIGCQGCSTIFIETERIKVVTQHKCHEIKSVRDHLAIARKARLGLRVGLGGKGTKTNDLFTHRRVSSRPHHCCKEWKDLHRLFLLILFFSRSRIFLSLILSNRFSAWRCSRKDDLHINLPIMFWEF